MASSEAEVLAHPAVVAPVEARLTQIEAALTVALARVAELGARLDGPPKTPENSSPPPSSAFRTTVPRGAVLPARRASPPRSVVPSRAIVR